MSGFIQLERSFFSTPEWKEERNLSHAEAMLYLIGKAGFEARTELYKGKYISLQAGELIASERYLAKCFSWSKTKTKRFLDKAQKRGYLTRSLREGEGIIALQGFICAKPQSGPQVGPESAPLRSGIKSLNLNSLSGSLKSLADHQTNHQEDHKADRRRTSEGPILNNINNNNNLNNKTPYSPPFFSKKIKVFSEQPLQLLCSGEGEEKEKSCAKKEKEVKGLPFSSDRFVKAWEDWKAYKQAEHGFGYKSPLSERACLNRLTKLSKGRESEALAIIEQSIANGWEGLFKLKTEDFDRGKKPSDLPCFSKNRSLYLNR